MTGNYGAIVVLGDVSYSYSSGLFQSALTDAQWNTLYAYQVQYGVRMVRLDVYPDAQFGTTTAIAGAGCCDANVEQLISITDASSFPTANLVAGATMSTENLWHYPATINNASIATEIAQFAAGGQFKSKTTAAVLNNIGGRQQMVWFTSWATDWNPTSNFLMHAWIHWATRGLYVGFRRVYFTPQVDDMFLETDLYQPAGKTFRVRPADLAAHVSWTKAMNAKMPAGSNFFVEIGHNGNGDIENAVQIDNYTGDKCTLATAIEYNEQIDTPIEFQKPVGSGTNIWPSSPNVYNWTLACAQLDPLEAFFANAANRDSFAHVSHTFSHESLNNATFSDATKEIVFNQAWLKQVGISNALHFSPNGLIPPAITGLHNGDVIKAWIQNGITHVVGDNTRPILLNTENEHWPLISTVAGNGYAGLQITPRWATNVYYNCATAACTVAEWIATSAGVGTITNLLTLEKNDNTRHLLGLRHDAFMFHQANMRQTDVGSIKINGLTSQLSLLQMWTETVAQEMIRLTKWPMISLKHDDLAVAFAQRMARDKCTPSLAYTMSGKTITGVTVSTTGNTCSAPIPVTFPGPVVSANGGRVEQVGADPLTVWVQMSGAPVSFTLSKPIAL